MRQLWPEPRNDVDLSDLYGASVAAPDGRPYVRLNMITSLDGAISVGGVSGALGGAGDRALFFVLRSLADLVVAGAGTVRAERYGPARLSPELRAERVARGQPPVPPIAVVTASAQLDWASPFFTDAEARPLVITASRGATTIPAGGRDVAEIVVAGEDRVDARQALDALGATGARHVLIEGGPALNGEFLAAGLLDEVCLTLSPRVAQGDGPRMIAGPALVPPVPTELVHVLEDGGFLFLRLRLRQPDPTPH